MLLNLRSFRSPDGNRTATTLLDGSVVGGRVSGRAVLRAGEALLVTATVKVEKHGSRDDGSHLAGRTEGPAQSVREEGPNDPVRRGETLSAAISALIGFGETCAKRMGWPYPKGVAAQRAYMAEHGR